MKWVLVFFFVSLGTVSAWQWPTDQLSQGLETSVDNSAAAGTRRLRFSFRGDGENISLRSPIDGEVIFLSFGREIEGGVYGSEIFPSLVLRDENEFWVIMWLEGLDRRNPELPFPERLTAGEPIGTVTSLELAVFDVLAQRYVNPRMLFPLRTDLPRDELPPIAVVQNGEYRNPSLLEVGRVDLVIPDERLRPALLPRNLYVLQDGLLQAQHQFIHADEISQMENESGDLQLYSTNISEGDHVIDIEARRFDGTVVKQTILLVVPPPLDTP